MRTAEPMTGRWTFIYLSSSSWQSTLYGGIFQVVNEPEAEPNTTVPLWWVICPKKLAGLEFALSPARMTELRHGGVGLSPGTSSNFQRK